MANRVNNPMQPTDLVAVNVNLIGSKMSTKREVSDQLLKPTNTYNLDLSFPSNRMQMLFGLNSEPNHLPFERSRL